MIRLLAARAVRVSAFVVAFLGVSAVSAFALPGEVHRYRLNQWTGLDDEIGGISLVALNGATEAANTGRSDDGITGTPGDSFTCLPATTRCEQGYRFGVGQGLSLSNPVFGVDGSYTIVMDFMLDPNAGGHKILDYSGLCTPAPACNAGLYVIGNSASLTRRLSYQKDSGSIDGIPGQILEDTMAQVVITRDASSRVKVWANSVLTFDWTDAATDASLTAPTLNFFMDDALTATGQAGGFVDTIRIFNRALDSSEVAALGEIEDLQFLSGTNVPEPGTLLLMGAGLFAIGVRLRKRHASK